ncbi:MAG: amidase domain-containing protein [Actinobacteria bacterium]|nr:amidase domain-containing protein [Actinomycetota bacterium]
MKSVNRKRITTTAIVILALCSILVGGILLIGMKCRQNENLIAGKKVYNEPVSEQEIIGFDQQAVIDYCRKYAEEGHYNEEQYPTFHGLDCTNFISQVLHHAGWEFTGDDLHEDNGQAWYCEYVDTPVGRKQVWSTTWINTDQWFHYTRTTGRGFDTTDWDGLRVGDVIQIDLNNDDILDHSMIVTTPADGDYRNVRVSGHTPDFFDYPLAKVFKTWPRSGKDARRYVLTATF